MPDVLLPITPGNLPPNYCWTSWQKFAVDLAAILFAKLSGQSFYNIGPDKPDVQFNSYPWFNTTDGRWYNYSGSWIAPHQYQLATSAGLRLEWEGTEGDLALFDGGDAGSASDRSGPMWEIDHNYDGRSSMGVGVIPTSNPSKTLSLSEDFGEGAHEMTEQEVGPHTHKTEFKERESEGNSNSGMMGFTGTTVDPVETTQNEYTTTQQNMPVVHPVRGNYKIKRTGRVYLIVP